MSSSSTLSPYVAGNVIDGSRQAVNSTVWLDNTFNSFPDWLEVSFSGNKTISEIDVITQQDDPQHLVEPTLTQTFSLYGITAFDVQYWTGSAWATVPGASVTGNNKVWRQFTFTPITTTKIRVVVNAGADNAYSRVVEVEAWGHDSTPAWSNLHWLVSDHLGTPRMILDQTGALANLKRHDYLPFGEELFAATGGRTAAQGYSSDGIRQQFTSKERDNETGLDYFNARYYASALGRFTSGDPIFISDKRTYNPQLWNLYNFVGNNPLNATDPTGMELVQLGQHSDKEIDKRRKTIDEEKKAVRKDSSLTKAQQDEKRAKLQAEKETLSLEKEGNRVVSQELASLDARGELNGLKLSDFTLSTDSKHDFDSDPRIGDDPGKGAGMFTLGGYTTQIYVNGASQDYAGAKRGDPDDILYGGTAARHEQVHRDGDASGMKTERAAYTLQLRILQQYGPTAFKSRAFYDNAIDHVTKGTKRKD